MNLKFLPIGSVCIANDGKKKMIIGYTKNDFDYVTVEYPEGYNSPETLSYLNHDQITDLFSLGYKNEEGISYWKSLMNDDATSVSPSTPTSNFKFDEKGVVVSDGTATAPTGNFKFDEKGVVVSDGAATAQQVISNLMRKVLS